MEGKLGRGLVKISRRGEGCCNRDGEVVDPLRAEVVKERGRLETGLVLLGDNVMVRIPAERGVIVALVGVLVVLARIVVSPIVFGVLGGIFAIIN